MDAGLLLLIVILGVYCLSSLLIARNDFLSPSFLSGGMFLISAVFLIPVCRKWGISINLITTGVIASGLMVFSIGESLGKRMVIGRKEKESNTKLPEVKPIKIKTVYSVLIFILMLIGTFLYYRYIRSVAYNMGFGSNSMYGLLYYFRNATLEGISVSSGGISGIFISLDSILSFAWGYIYLYIFSYNLILCKSKYNIIIHLMICGVYLVQTVLTAGRTGFLYYAAAAFAMFIAMYDYKTVKHINNRRFIKQGVKAFIVVLIVFYALGSLTGKTAVYSFMDTLAVYVGSPILAFNDFLENGISFSNNDLWGGNTFIGLYDILQRFGVISDDVSIVATAPFCTLTNGTSTNIYTSFMRYINDFTYVGFLIVEVLLGVFWGMEFRYVKIKKRLGLPLIVYSIIILCIFQVSIEERIFMNIISLGYFLRFVAVFVMYKILLERKIRIRGRLK